MKPLSKKLPNLKIVTPSYNQGHFIRQTIQSVVGQMRKGDEYWVMDGGSTDDTREILKSYGDRLKWISKLDKGQANAINKGLEKIVATSDDQDIVSYINSDDYYVPGSLDFVRRTFAVHPEIQWLVGDAQIVDAKGHEIQRLIRAYKTVLRYLPLCLMMSNPYPQPSLFLRVGVIKKIGNFKEDLHFVMDYEYWLRTIGKYGRPFLVPKILSAFRIHQDSKGGSKYREQFAEEYQVFCKYVKNPVFRILHRLHSVLIVIFYQVLKS